MADLPQISADLPVVIPAVAEKTYPDLYITDLVLRTNATDLSDATVLTVFYPYNYATKESLVGPEYRQEFSISNLWTEAARALMVASVMGQLVAMVGLMRQEQSLVVQIAAAKEGADTSALASQLAAVRTSLGIVS